MTCTGCDLERAAASAAATACYVGFPLWTAPRTTLQSHQKVTSSQPHLPGLQHNPKSSNNMSNKYYLQLVLEMSDSIFYCIVFFYLQCLTFCEIRKNLMYLFSIQTYYCLKTDNFLLFKPHSLPKYYRLPCRSFQNPAPRSLCHSHSQLTLSTGFL